MRHRATCSASQNHRRLECIRGWKASCACHIYRIARQHISGDLRLNRLLAGIQSKIVISALLVGGLPAPGRPAARSASSDVCKKY